MIGLFGSKTCVSRGQGGLKKKKLEWQCCCFKRSIVECRICLLFASMIKVANLAVKILLNICLCFTGFRRFYYCRGTFFVRVLDINTQPNILF